jgi:hypothetical protein
MVVDLDEELSGNNIKFDKVENQYIIDIDGSDLIVQMKGKILSMYFNLKDTDRTIDVELEIKDEATYIDSIEFLLIFISFLKDVQEHFEELTNEEIENRISSSLKEFNFENVIKVEVEGKDLLSFEVFERPLTNEEIKEELARLEEYLNKALDDNNKELYDYYQKKYNELKSQLKESVSFRFIKNFKDFFDK